MVIGSFLIWHSVQPVGLLRRAGKRNQSSSRMLVLAALLLLALPLLLTFAKFVALVGDSSHQLQRFQPITNAII